MSALQPFGRAAEQPSINQRWTQGVSDTPMLCSVSVTRERSNKDLMVGTWRQEGDPDWVSSVEYIISKASQGLEVAAIDRRDGERLKVSAVDWDGKRLTFRTLCVSTQHRATITMIPKKDSLADLLLSYTEKEEWRKI